MGLQEHATVLSSPVRAGDPNSAPHALVVGILMTEPSSRALEIVFNMIS